MKIKESKGLTFVEVLVIVGIISIIGAIALSELTGYAHKTSVQTTLQNMAKAQEEHQASYGYYVACASVRECELALNGIHFKPAGNVERSPSS